MPARLGSGPVTRAKRPITGFDGMTRRQVAFSRWLAGLMVGSFIASAAVAQPLPGILPDAPAPVPAEPRPDAVVDVDTSAMVRNVNTPQPTDWRPSAVEEEAPLALFLRYRATLRAGDLVTAYAMLSDGLRAEISEADSVTIDRERRWYDGPVKLTRMTWYPDPAGAAPGLYVAIDFASVLPDGSFSCGYVIIHRAAGQAGYAVSRVDSSYIPSELATAEHMPGILANLPCWLGPGVATSLNPG